MAVRHQVDQRPHRICAAASGGEVVDGSTATGPVGYGRARSFLTSLRDDGATHPGLEPGCNSAAVLAGKGGGSARHDLDELAG